MSSNLESLRKKIAEKTNELFFEYFFKKLVDDHCRTNWRDCDCSYCKTKRVGTTVIANTKVYIYAPWLLKDWYPDYYREAKKLARKPIKEKVRNQLQELRKEVL